MHREEYNMFTLQCNKMCVFHLRPEAVLDCQLLVGGQKTIQGTCHVLVKLYAILHYRARLKILKLSLKRSRKTSVFSEDLCPSQAVKALNYLVNRKIYRLIRSRCRHDHIQKTECLEAGFSDTHSVHNR